MNYIVSQIKYHKMNPIPTRVLCLLLIVLVTVVITAQAQENVIIPKPLELSMSRNYADFAINNSTHIIADKEFLSEAKILSIYLQKVTGQKVSYSQEVDNDPSKSGIFLKYTTAKNIPKEGYIMDVSDKKIQIIASHSSGAYYGCMTLLQTIIKDKDSRSFKIASMHIEDHPRFAWRGLMLDCSRTFISLDYLKKTIDRMSFYKLNTLHLHLTDDQGWRLEIKKYPLLTDRGAFFDPKYNEPKEFQGFYTQDQMKELVNYAKRRHIAIVPEVEFPGHSHAALYAYPELSCNGDISSIYPFFSGPNITTTVFCPTNRNTYLLFKNITMELAKIFPSSYIHLGGDEVPKNAWSNCDKCQTMITSLGITDEKHLQGYMMNRVGDYVKAVNKRPIGWDEVFGEGVGKDWVIMVWRGEGKGLEEVKAGNDVVLCPTSNLYFDYSYSTTPTKKVYSFEPIPGGISDAEEKHYLGIQACFWSHIDRTETRIDYQLFPRVLALAERSWSEKSVTDYDNFYQREIEQRFWLNYFDIKYNEFSE